MANPSGNSPPAQDANKPRRRPKPKQQAPDLQMFFEAVLKGIGAPVTSANIAFMNAWARKEAAGGAYNPFNTKTHEPGSVGLPVANKDAAGVQSYTNWREGVKATISTLLNGYYPDLVSAFKTGNISTQVAYPGLEKWGTGSIANESTAPYVLYAGALGKDPLTGAPGEKIPQIGTAAERQLATQDGQQPVLSKGDLAAGLSKDGFAIGLIDHTPELKQVFGEALQKNWSVDRALLAIQNTNWFQRQSAAQRQFDELQYSDPQQLQRKIGQTADDLRQMEASFGVQVGDLHNLATLVVRNGMDAQEQQAAIASAFKYAGQGLTGQAGTDIDALQQLSQQYAVGMTNKQLTDMARRMMVGQLDPNAVTDFFKQQALSKFPQLKAQLNNGQTVEDVANPYKVEMAKYWYDNSDYASNIKTENPQIMKALQQNTKDGQQLMPLWQFQQQLKQDPRWLRTQNAQDSLMDSTTSLLQNMGLISGGVNVGTGQSTGLA